MARAGWTQPLWAVPPVKIPEPVLPTSYARPSWYPDRGQTLWTAIVAAAAPTWGYEVLGPQRIPPPWNPDRGQQTWNPFQFAAITVPAWGYEVLGPQRLAPWNPERSQVASTSLVTPRPGAGPVLPERFRQAWNPERSWSSSVPLIVVQSGFSTTLPEAQRPQWLPDRGALVVPVRIAPAPLLSWRPELVERFIAPRRAAPNLDIWLPPFPQPGSQPQQIIFLLRGVRDAYSLGAVVDAYLLRGIGDLYMLQGSKAAYGLSGAKDTYSASGTQDAHSLLGRQEDVGANIMPLTQTFSVPLGDDVSIALAIFQSNGTTALDLTGGQLVFGLKKRLSDVAVLVTKSSPASGIVISAPATAGLATLTLNAADTASLDDGPYAFDVQFISAAAKKSTVITGTLTLIQHPTR